jgi:hypothetical protein
MKHPNDMVQMNILGRFYIHLHIEVLPQENSKSQDSFTYKDFRSEKFELKRTFKTLDNALRIRWV